MLYRVKRIPNNVNVLKKVPSKYSTVHSLTKRKITTYYKITCVYGIKQIRRQLLVNPAKMKNRQYLLRRYL